MVVVLPRRSRDHPITCGRPVPAAAVVDHAQRLHFLAQDGVNSAMPTYLSLATAVDALDDLRVVPTPTSAPRRPSVHRERHRPPAPAGDGRVSGLKMPHANVPARSSIRLLLNSPNSATIGPYAYGLRRGRRTIRISNDRISFSPELVDSSVPSPAPGTGNPRLGVLTMRSPSRNSWRRLPSRRDGLLPGLLDSL